jgi:hypothetical protein
MPDSLVITVEDIVKETDKSIRVKYSGRNYNCAKSIIGWEGLKKVGSSWLVETYQSPFEYNGKEVMMTWIESLTPSDPPSGSSGGGSHKGGGGGGSTDQSIERQVALKEAGATLRLLLAEKLIAVEETNAKLISLYKVMEQAVTGKLTMEALKKDAQEKLGATEEPDPPAPPSQSGSDIGSDDDIPF